MFESIERLGGRPPARHLPHCVHHASASTPVDNRLRDAEERERRSSERAWWVLCRLPSSPVCRLAEATPTDNIRTNPAQRPYEPGSKISRRSPNARMRRSSCNHVGWAAVVCLRYVLQTHYESRQRNQQSGKQHGATGTEDRFQLPHCRAFPLNNRVRDAAWPSAGTVKQVAWKSELQGPRRQVRR